MSAGLPLRGGGSRIPRGQRGVLVSEPQLLLRCWKIATQAGGWRLRPPLRGAPALHHHVCWTVAISGDDAQLQDMSRCETKESHASAAWPEVGHRAGNGAGDVRRWFHRGRLSKRTIAAHAVTLASNCVAWGAWHAHPVRWRRRSIGRGGTGRRVLAFPLWPHGCDAGVASSPRMGLRLDRGVPGEGGENSGDKPIRLISDNI